ncbi:hypothetical protein [Peribacillus simplex]|uniref:hypothetical protein n=1 Tax=Peribacillus simplex TaxID=1478 RepID=UPI000A8E0437|nr:hypothetical protein [Peribacillus simplex]
MKKFIIDIPILIMIALVLYQKTNETKIPKEWMRPQKKGISPSMPKKPLITF